MRCSGDALPSDSNSLSRLSASTAERSWGQNRHNWSLKPQQSALQFPVRLGDSSSTALVLARDLYILEPMKLLSRV